MALTRDEMEARRFQALADIGNGVTRAAIAQKFGVSRQTASRWVRVVVRGDLEALRKRRATGRPPKLKPAQFAELPAIYRQGSSSGMPWSASSFTREVERRFGVRYDPDHMGRIMRRIDFSSDSEIRHPEPSDIPPVRQEHPSEKDRAFRPKIPPEGRRPT